MRNRVKRCAIAMALLMAGAVGAAHLARGQQTARPARMHVAGSETLFAGVNRSDATASMRVWIDALGRRRGFAFDTSLDLVPGPVDVLARLRSKSLDMLILDTPDYLALEGSGLVELIGVPHEHGKPAPSRYLLLTASTPAGANPPAAPSTVEDLKGKRIVICSHSGSGMGLAWLETYLAEKRLGRAAQFFSTVTTTLKPSACVLPLFFGRVDACVVSANNWQLMVELNPQVGKLKMLAQSPGLLEGLVAMPVEPHPYRAELIQALMDLDKDPAGAQMAVLFRIKGLVPAPPGTLDAVRAVWSAYQRLLKESAGGIRKSTAVTRNASSAGVDRTASGDGK